MLYIILDSRKGWKDAHRQGSPNPHQISPPLSIKMLSDHLPASVNSAFKKISISLQPVPWWSNSQVLRSVGHNPPELPSKEWSSWRGLVSPSPPSTNPQQTPLTHSLVLPCPTISKTITLENKTKTFSSQQQAQADRVPAAETPEAPHHAQSNSSKTAEPDWGKHIESSAASNSLKAARAIQVRIKHQYLHGCKLHPSVRGGWGWTTERLLWEVLVQHILPPSSGVPTARRKAVTWKISFESSPPSIMLGPRFAACTLPLVSNLFPGRVSALPHSVYGHKQAARTNFTASTQPCCCFLFFGKKGLSNLLPPT